MKRHWATSGIRCEPVRRGAFPARTGTYGAGAGSAGVAFIFFLSALFICLWVAAVPLAEADGGTSVDAQVDRTVVPPGESLQLTVAIHNGSGDVDTGPLTEFRVLSGGTSTSLQIINGVSSREEDHTYMLIPRRTGHLTIPALTVTVNGSSYQTQPIDITVSSQRSSPAANRTKDVWVHSTLSDSRPYVGQQITYTFSLYQAVQVTDATFQAPDFSGFSAKKIKNNASEHRIINGRDCLVTRIQYILVPLDAGRHSIAPGVLQLGILRPSRQRYSTPFDDFFNAPFFNRTRVEPKVLQSRSLRVQVRPLPPYTGSDSFSGLVGRFELTAHIKDTRLKVSDSTTLTICVQGHGNIMDAQAPALKLPTFLKSYADTPVAQIQLKPDGYSGKKTYRTALVPLKAGLIQLPPVHLTYFDVARERYRTLTAALPELTVQPAALAQATPLTVTAEPPGGQKEEVAFTGRDILPPKEDLKALESHRALTWPLFLMWLGLPVLAFGTLYLAQQLRRQDTSPKARMRSKALSALKAAQAAGDAHDVFLTALYQSLSAAIYAYADRSGEALTWKEAEALLREHGLNGAEAKAAADLLTAIETQRFSGAQLHGDMQNDLLERTRRMIRRLAP